MQGAVGRGHPGSDAHSHLKCPEHAGEERPSGKAQHLPPGSPPPSHQRAPSLGCLRAMLPATRGEGSNAKLLTRRYFRGAPRNLLRGQLLPGSCPLISGSGFPVPGRKLQSAQEHGACGLQGEVFIIWRLSGQRTPPGSSEENHKEKTERETWLHG